MHMLSDQFLDVFFFKLCRSWLDCLESYTLEAAKHNKSNLHGFPLYINVSISYSFKIVSTDMNRTAGLE